jgi:outer membrane protein assembly factor BamA
VALTVYLAPLSMKHFLLLFFLLLISHCLFGGQVKIQSITVSGNKVTRAEVILREISIGAGDIIESDSIASLVNKNKLRLFNLGLFNEVSQQTHIRGDVVEWEITVKERWYIIPSGTLQFAERNFNNWWRNGNHDLRRVTAGVTITDNNFRGNLELLSATVQAGFNEKVGLAYTRPYINKKQTSGIGFNAGYARSRQAYYVTEGDKLKFTGDYYGRVISSVAEGGVTYIYRPKYISRHIFHLGYFDYNVADTVLKLNPSYYAEGSTRARFVELRYRHEYNGVDNWNYPLQGYKAVGIAVIRQGFQGLKFQSYVNVEAGAFKHLLGKLYASAIFRGRLMYPDNQPYFFRGGLGMHKDYVRGYEYYVTDGYNYGVARLNLKHEILNSTAATNIKYFSAIPVRVYVKLFFDAGYINNPSPLLSALANTPLYSYGAGVDIVTLYDVKIRIEYARNHLGENGLYLHFNSE